MILQSQVRNLPPRLRPLREALRWAKASTGRVFMGLPSSASNVRELIPANAVSGSSLRRLNPRSRTCKD